MIKFARRKRRNRNFRRRRDGITPGLLITAVQKTLEGLKVSFAGSMSWDGASVPGTFRADTSDGPLDGCINVLATGSNWIEVEFNGSVDVGANWLVDGPMAGITPAVAWPQSGTVTA